MSRSASVSVLLICLLLPACQTFGGGGDGESRHAHRGGGGNHEHNASRNQNADCERLAPFVVSTDGNLARSDLEIGLKGEFKKWDTNGDGQLSGDETRPLNDHLRALNVGASPVMDWNGDGHVSYDEFASGWRTMFDICAHEGSEVVTKADLEHSPNVAPPRNDEHKRPEGASSDNTGGGGYQR